MASRIVTGIVLTLAAVTLRADKLEPTPSEIEQIIAKFAAKEAEFAQARANYTWRQTVRIQEVEPSGGRFDLVSDITFIENKRTERVVKAPSPTLQRIILTPEDEKDLRDVQPFVLTTKEIPNYYVRYLGKETLDEIPCYAFAVKPKTMEKGERYFSGIIWVDDEDLQIVKSYGRATGLSRKGYDNQFPKFETYREQIDGKYWFPTYTIADSILPFESGPQRIKMSVKYEDYKQYKAESTITFGETIEPGKTPPSPDPNAPKPPAAPPKKQ